MTNNPDLPCPHLHFQASATVGRIMADHHDPIPVAYMCELQVRCTDCDEEFRFNGAPAGLSYSEPTCTVDETTLHAPMRPASADPDFGMGLPGFAIRGWDGTTVAEHAETPDE